VSALPPPVPDRSRVHTTATTRLRPALVPSSRSIPNRIAAATPLEDILSFFDIRSGSVTAAIPNRFDFLEGDSGTFIADGGADMYDSGNFIGTTLGGPLPYTNGAILGHPALGDSGRYFTRKVPGLFLAAMDLDTVDWVRISGNLGADGQGSADGATIDFDFGGTSHRVYLKRVFGTDDPSVNHVFILPEAFATTHSYALVTDDDFEQVSGLNPRMRVYYLLFAGSSGAHIADSAIVEIVETFLGAVQAGDPWLSVSPVGGSVPVAGSVPIEVRLNARDLTPAQYGGSLHLFTNDPSHPLTNVPVGLEVKVLTGIGISLVSASAESDRVQVMWRSGGGELANAIAERRERESEWREWGAVAPDGEGYLRLEDRDVVGGRRYGYRLAYLDQGARRTAGETWVEVPPSARLALRGLQPNPSAGDLDVAFGLPDGQPATLELLDLAGRRLRAEQVGGRGPGNHVVSLGRKGALPAGVYLLRLRRADRELTAKCVILP
jgi:hypothetical protein